MSDDKTMIVFGVYLDYVYEARIHPYNNLIHDEQFESGIRMVKSLIRKDGKAEMTKAFTFSYDIL